MEVAILLVSGLCQLVEADIHSRFFHCSKESLAVAQIFRKCGRVKVFAGSCPCSSLCIFLSQVYPVNLCGVPVGTLRRDLVEMTVRFTYAANQNLVFEILKPLKAIVGVGVGSCSWGPLGHTEEEEYMEGGLVVSVGLW